MTPRVLVVAGATATGKTALAERVASRLGAEIVCADARQVYRELEIGTGKPTPAERAAQPHHLFDQLRLGERTSAGRWARAARDAVAGISRRGRITVLVGGSGLYLEALRHGLSPEPPADPAVRARLLDEMRAQGPEAMHARLAAIDPASAARLAPADRQRIARALEVWHASGRTLTDWNREPRRDPLAAQWRTVLLEVPVPELDERITRRAGEMFEAGLVAETRALLDAGAGPALAALRAVGYDEAAALVHGALDRPQAVMRTVLRTRQLAKRQRTWFRHRLPDAVRLAAGDGPVTDALLERALALARELARGAG